MSYPERRASALTGYWYAEIKHQKNGRFRRRFKTKDVADSYEAHVKAFGAEPDWAQDQGATEIGLTFADVARELRERGGPKGHWRRGRDRSILQRLDFVCGSKLGTAPVERVSYGMAEELVENLAKRPGTAGRRLSDHTINRYLTAVSAVMTYAEEKGYVDKAPRLPWRDAEQVKCDYYSEDQERAVVSWLNSQGQPVAALLVTILAMTGLRAGELCGLKREQIVDEYIDLDDPEQVKNNTVRSVWIGREKADALRALVASGSMLKRDTLHKHVHSALKACGIDIKRALHSLRHTAASRTVNEEQDIHIAQQLLGHKSIQTTLRYRHVSRDVLRERAKKIAHGRGKALENTATGEVVDFKKQA